MSFSFKPTAAKKHLKKSPSTYNRSTTCMGPGNLLMSATAASPHLPYRKSRQSRGYSNFLVLRTIQSFLFKNCECIAVKDSMNPALSCFLIRKFSCYFWTVSADVQNSSEDSKSSAWQSGGSSRGPKLNSQNLHGSSLTFATCVLGESGHSCHPCPPGMHMV